jgi:tetratricopeptide (TPR) repeat protein
MLAWIRKAFGTARGAASSAAAETGEWAAQAAVLKDAGDFERSADLFQRVLDRDPEHAASLHGLGEIEAYRHHDDLAAGLLQRAVSLDDSRPGSRYILGCLAQSRGDRDAAAASYRRALALDPAYAPAHLNLGFILQQRGEADEALAHFRAAAGAAPANADAWVNLGYALERRRELAEARGAYDRALQIDPRHFDARFNRSMVLLALGEYEAGWRDYESRWQASGFPRPSYPQPEWDGSPADGQTVLLYSEQGYGDALQFARYATLVAERGARVVLRCPRELHAVLGSIAGVSRVIAPDETAPFDRHASLLSLPLLFGTRATTIPEATPYVRADPERVRSWAGRIQADRGLKVGLVWASQSQMPNVELKSVPLQALAPLAAAQGVRFYSLQMGEAGKAVSASPIPLVDLAPGIRDFGDTAAILANLDLTISVDTAVAHLAGALARPAWTMLQYAPDWRWYPDSAASRWYPGMRLYQQPRPGDWQAVCAEVARDLGALARATYPT